MMLAVICQLAHHMLRHSVQQGLWGAKQGLILGEQLRIRPHLQGDDSYDWRAGATEEHTWVLSRA